jgi:hypothetical protein
MKKLIISVILMLLLFIFVERINSSETMEKKSKLNKKINKSARKAGKRIKVKVGKKHRCLSKQRKYCKKICRKSSGLNTCVKKAKLSYKHKSHHTIHFLIVKPLCICNKYSHKFRVIAKK